MRCWCTVCRDTLYTSSMCAWCTVYIRSAASQRVQCDRGIPAVSYRRMSDCVGPRSRKSTAYIRWTSQCCLKWLARTSSSSSSGPPNGRTILFTGSQITLHHSIYRLPFSSKYSPSFRSVRHTMIAVPLKLLTKLASVAGHFFCEPASALLSYFSQYILLIAYRGVSVESAVAQCDGASDVDENRTTTTTLHQRTTLEGTDEPSIPPPRAVVQRIAWRQRRPSGGQHV